MGDFDPTRYDALLEVPVAEVMLACEQRLRQHAGEDYRVQLLAWAAIAGGGRSKKRKPPEPPAILRGN